MSKEIEEFKDLINESNFTVAVTGSGISYLYGMSRLKSIVRDRGELMKITTPTYAETHPQQFYELLYNSFMKGTFELGPSGVHYKLVELEKKGKLQGIVTQNMDCMHTIAGSSNVIEFQGTFADNTCVKCGERVLDYKVWGEGHCPTCPKCGGPLMPSNFANTYNGREKMQQAIDLISKADLIIVMGTTGFRSDEYLSKMKRSAKLVQINPSPTVFSSWATLNIKDDADIVLTELLNDL